MRTSAAIKKPATALAARLGSLKHWHPLKSFYPPRPRFFPRRRLRHPFCHRNSSLARQPPREFLPANIFREPADVSPAGPGFFPAWHLWGLEPAPFSSRGQNRRRSQTVRDIFPGRPQKLFWGRHWRRQAMFQRPALAVRLFVAASGSTSWIRWVSAAARRAEAPPNLVMASRIAPEISGFMA